MTTTAAALAATPVSAELGDPLLYPGEISIYGLAGIACGVDGPMLCPAARYARKRDAEQHVRELGLWPAVRPVRARDRGGPCWVLLAFPAGGPSDVRVLLARESGWLVQCVSGCVDRGVRCGFCPGHLMAAVQAAEFTEALRL